MAPTMVVHGEPCKDHKCQIASCELCMKHTTDEKVWSPEDFILHYSQAEEYVAPGLLQWPNGDGEWQGAPVCKDCTENIIKLFKLINEGKCFDCNLPWEQHVANSEICEESTQRDNRMWNRYYNDSLDTL